MITAVSGIKAPAFKGTEEVETNTNSIKDVSGQVDSFTKEANETTESLSNAMTTATSSLGTLGTSALGLWALFKSPFEKIKIFFTKPVMKEVDETVIENGQEVVKKVAKPVTEDVIDKKTGKAVLNDAGEKVTKMVRTADWKKIGIAGGIVVAIGALFGIKKANKAKNAQKADELKHQQELREIEQAKEIAAAKASAEAE